MASSEPTWHPEAVNDADEALIYRVEGEIEIVAVAHQKRRPYYWKHR